VRLELHAEPVAMDLPRAVPIGLILNELFCNALKHAFSGELRGTIRVTVDSTGFEFADDGIGLPRDFDPAHSPSLGLQLVQILVRQIRGTMTVESGAGTRFRVALASLAG
jgi:two-component sensor histidine kinase